MGGRVGAINRWMVNGDGNEWAGSGRLIAQLSSRTLLRACCRAGISALRTRATVSQALRTPEVSPD